MSVYAPLDINHIELIYYPALTVAPTHNNMLCVHYFSSRQFINSNSNTYC